MEPVVSIDVSRFNASMDAYVRQLGLVPAEVIKRQAGMLIKTLINITPPTNRSKSSKGLTKHVQNKFGSLSRTRTIESTREKIGANDKYAQKRGKGEILWYSWRSTVLYGVMRELDWTDKDEDTLYHFWNVMKKVFTKGGSVIRGQRGKQKVLIRRRILTNRKAVEALIKRLISHFGRMKASWTVAWEDLFGNLDGLDLPQWVAKHAGKSNHARGYSINGLGIPGEPTFSIASYAVGVGEQIRSSKGGFVSKAQRALDIRALAMRRDLAFAFSNPVAWKLREFNAGRDTGTFQIED